MAYNINKRVFGADIDPIIKRKLAARQRLAARAPLTEDQKFTTQDPYYLKGSGLTVTDPITDYTPSNFKGIAELSSRKPFARMWIAMDVINWVHRHTRNTEYMKRHRLLKEVGSISSEDPSFRYEKGLEEDEYWEYQIDTNSSLKRVYIIGNNVASRTNTSALEKDSAYTDTEGRIVLTDPSITGNIVLKPEEFTTDEFFPPQLQTNNFLKDQAGIKSVSVSTEGSLGLIKKTKVDFSVSNWNDFDKIIFPYFMNPGAKVWVDYGWDVADLYQPECLTPQDSTGFRNRNSQCPDEWKDATLETKIYGEHGILTKAVGDMDVIEGTVVSWDANYTTDGRIECTIELISGNSALFGGDFDDIHDQFRDLVIQDLDELFLGKALSMFVPTAATITALRQEKQVNRWEAQLVKDISEGKISIFSLLENVIDSKDYSGKSEESIDLWQQIGSLLFRLAQQFLSYAPGNGFGDMLISPGKTTDFSDAENKAFWPIVAGVYYRKGDEKQGFNVDNLYISWGRFEDEILNKHYGFGESMEDITNFDQGNLDKKWDSSESYTTWKESLVERQLAEYDAGKLPFLIPSIWGMWSEKPKSKYQDHCSWTFSQLKHPGFDANIWKINGEDVEEAYEHTEITPAINISAQGGTWGGNLTRHSHPRDTHQVDKLPGFGNSNPHQDRAAGRIPIREIFVRLDVIRDAMRENNNIKECVAQILDTLNQSSATVWNWKMGTNTAASNNISIIDYNYSHASNAQSDPQGEKFKSLFMFRPYSPNTIVKNFDLKFSTPSDEISSMIAIQGNSRVGSIIPLNKIADEKMMSKINFDHMHESIEEGIPEDFIQIRYNPNPTSEFDSVKNNKLQEDYLKNVNENRQSFLSTGIGSYSPKKFNTRIGLNASQYEQNYRPNPEDYKKTKPHSYKSSEISETAEIINKKNADDKKKTMGDTIDEDTSNHVKGVFNYYTKLTEGEYLAKEHSSILPAKLSMDIYGTAGLFNGDCFRVDALPRKYQDKTYFQITQVKQKIDTNTWTTSLDTQFRIHTSAKKQVYNQNIEYFTSPKTFKGLRGFKEIIPHITKIKPIPRYGYNNIRYARHLFNFTCKKSGEFFVKGHMPIPPRFDAINTANINRLIEGWWDIGANEIQSMSDTGGGFNLVDMTKRHQRAYEQAILKNDPAALGPSKGKAYADPPEQIPVDVTEVLKADLAQYINDLVEGKVEYYWGNRKITLPTLPFSKTWRKNWGTKDKFESKIKLERDQEYVLFERKPFWYIFPKGGQSAEIKKQWHDYFDSMFWLSKDFSKGPYSGFVGLSGVPNLSENSYDMYQGRKYFTFEHKRKDKK